MIFDVPYFCTRPELDLSRGSRLASGYDLRADLGLSRTVEPGSRWFLRTGVHLAMPAGVEAHVRPRSGWVRDEGMVTAYGSIDADYRGEICVNVFNHSNRPVDIHPLHRVAQLVFAPVLLDASVELTIEEQVATRIPFGGPRAPEWPLRVRLVRVEKREDLGQTDRGTKGFGSSGR